MFPVRWRIFWMLFGFGFMAYLQQKSITVASERMMPELHLSQVQIGWIEWAFVLGYGLLQLPGGVVGQRLGARRTFVAIGIMSFLATALTPLSAFALSGTTLFLTLLGLQLLLGFSQAAIFPVSAGVFEAWFPPHRWSLVQGLQTMGLGLGAALTPPLIASLMSTIGWQNALLWASVPAVALVAVWAWYGRDTPRMHPAMTDAELAEIGARHDAVDSRIDLQKLILILRNRSVMLLALAYLCMNYTFYLLSNWVFLYLVQERHFSILESGWLASAPPLAAAIGAGVGGALTGMLCRRLGTRWGFRAVPLVALTISGVLLLIAVDTASPYGAVAALSLSFGFVELSEGAFWGAAMSIGRADAMAVGGAMNTGGNLGGIIGIPIVAYLSGEHLWRTAFLIGLFCALASAVAWLAVDVEPLEDSEAEVKE
jgi:ACS family glucarate transporter-like MFS transporter